MSQVLLVEDNPGDIRLTQEAFRESKIDCVLDVARDGETALALLRGRPPYNEALRPNLILLDLNLPKKDGKQVLMELKADPKLRSIPVAIFSSSRSREDVVSTYSSYANCYISKPMNFEELVRVVRSIEEFWLKSVSHPEKREQGQVI